LLFIHFASPPISLVVQNRFLVARAKKQAPKPKRAGKNHAGSPLFVSAKGRGGKGIAGLKRRKPASGKKTAAFFGEANSFLPGRGPMGL
jgi:hypothetical protein